MSDVDKRQMNVSIRGDKGTPMGVMIDIKQALREINVLNVNYAAVFENKIEE